MIETERLSLTRPLHEDLDESYAMYADASVVTYIGGKPSTRGDALTKLLRNIGHWQVFGYGLYTVREKSSGSFVGEVGLAHFARELGQNFDPFPEAAWVLARHHHGKGYATEALRAAHDRMARQREAVRTVCIIDPDNSASLRVAEKLGYDFIGEAQYRGGAVLMFERLRR
jgi:RimJ/RimL family protein N-acetyltransferase